MAGFASTQRTQPARATSGATRFGPLASDSPQSMVARKGSYIAAAFLFTLAIPVFFNLGFIRMSPYRVILLVMFIPLIAEWLTGKCGRILAADILLLLFGLWTIIATFGNHGATEIEFSGIFFLETLGPYLLARRYVRNLGDFLRVTRVLFWLMLLFIPFAFLEAKLARQVYTPLFRFFGETIPYAGYDPRWGMDRAQVAFEHPILFGVFCSTTFALLFYRPLKAKDGIYGLWTAWASIAATFFSLSSGAFIPIGLQAGLMIYNRVMRALDWRWWLFLGGFVFVYVAIDLGSNRTPFNVFASALAFSNSTYYWRVLIFQYGIQNVWADPLFGFGLGRGWARPSFMVTSTVDNFWLVMAMRYGVPGFALILATFLAVIGSLIRARVTTPIAINQRYALVFSLASVGVAISTVFLWNATLVYLMFLLGAGSWMTDIKPGDAPQDDDDGDQNSNGPGADKASAFNRPASQKLAFARSPVTVQKPSDGRKYSRVKPRGTQDNTDE